MRGWARTSRLAVWTAGSFASGNAIYDARVQAGDRKSERWGLSGFYASVVQPGTVRAGDTIALLS